MELTGALGEKVTKMTKDSLVKSHKELGPYNRSLSTDLCGVELRLSAATGTTQHLKKNTRRKH